MRVEPRIYPPLIPFWCKGCFLFGGLPMISFFQLMKHCFDFKGKTSRGEYFMGLLSFVFIGGFLRICESLIWLFVFDFPPETASKTSIFLVFGIIALYSLSCRRLRDAGYSERALKWITFPFGYAIAFFVSLLPNEIQVKK